LSECHEAHLPFSEEIGRLTDLEKPEVFRSENKAQLEAKKVENETVLVEEAKSQVDLETTSQQRLESEAGEARVEAGWTKTHVAAARANRSQPDHPEKLVAKETLAQAKLSKLDYDRLADKERLEATKVECKRLAAEEPNWQTGLERSKQEELKAKAGRGAHRVSLSTRKSTKSLLAIAQATRRSSRLLCHSLSEEVLTGFEAERQAEFEIMGQEKQDTQVILAQQETERSNKLSAVEAATRSQSNHQDTLAANEVAKRTRSERIGQDRLVEGFAAKEIQQERQAAEEAERKTESELIEQERPEAEAELRKTLLVTREAIRFEPHRQETSASQEAALRVKSERIEQAKQGVGGGIAAMRAKLERVEQEHLAEEKSKAQLGTSKRLKRPQLKQTLSNHRGHKQQTHLEERLNDELNHIIQDIWRLGDPNVPAATFGAIFDDDAVQQRYEALAATLKAAKKRGILTYSSPILLKGMHDKVMVTLVDQSPLGSKKEETGQS